MVKHGAFGKFLVMLLSIIAFPYFVNEINDVLTGGTLSEVAMLTMFPYLYVMIPIVIGGFLIKDAMDGKI